MRPVFKTLVLAFRLPVAFAAVALGARAQTPRTVTVTPKLSPPAGVKPPVTAPGLQGAGPVEDAALVIAQPNQGISPKADQTTVSFHYALRNASKEKLVINDVRTSCGCTVARLPSKPWILSPGETGDLQLDVDLRNKTGTLVKTATILTGKGQRLVVMEIHLPPGGVIDPVRQQNVQVALKDRQAVFKGDCARCHVPPPMLAGQPLYAAACGVCHEAEHRGTMVPDLHALTHPTDRDFWRTTIKVGKDNTLMPGFSREVGGPLTNDQIDSLVEYLMSNYPSNPGPK